MKTGEQVGRHHYLEHIGEYRGIQYVILFCDGGWRTAYVRLEDTLGLTDYMQFDELIDVHGGFTFGALGLPFQKKSVDNDYWLGWDYAHYGDGYDVPLIRKYFGNDKVEKMFFAYYAEGHIYTLIDVIQECLYVIDKYIEVKEK